MKDAIRISLITQKNLSKKQKNDQFAAFLFEQEMIRLRGLYLDSVSPEAWEQETKVRNSYLPLFRIYL